MKTKEIINTVSALAIWAAVILCALAIVSYTSADESSMTRIEPAQPVQNLVGPFGAFISHHLLMQIGIAVWALLAIAGLYAYNLLLDRPISNPWLRVYGCLFFIVSLSALLAMFDGIDWADGIGRGLPCSFGGIVGQSFSRLLVGLLSIPGTIILLLLVLISSLLVLSNMWVYEIAAAGIKKLWAYLSKPSEPGPVKKVFEQPVAKEKEKAPSGEVGGRLLDIPKAELPPEVKPASRKPAQAQPDEKNLFDVSEDLYGDETELEEVTEIDPLEPIAPAKPAEPVAPPVAVKAPGPQKDLIDKKEKREREFKRLAADDGSSFVLPPLSLYDPPTTKRKDFTTALEANARSIEQCLKEFELEAKVVAWEVGPVVTLYELALPPGVKVSVVSSLQDNLAMSLRAQSLRIIAPIPGKPTVGIEIPNPESEIVRFRDIAEHPQFDISKYRLPFFLGKQGAGEPLVADLTKMPHILIAGATNSGKSVCINALIATLLTYKKPDEVKFILIDPKMVELSTYQRIPHLLAPVVTDMRQAPGVLDWAVNAMEDRYKICSRVSVKDIVGYNKLGAAKLDELIPDPEERAEFPDSLPYIILVVDELADLMMISKKEVEWTITRLAQKARAIGVHLVLATQRPSVNVITGLIKANMPCRISFQLSSKVDSRTIIDGIGAEKLLGRGDMLFMPPGSPKLIRAQGVFVSDDEIKKMLDFLRDQGEPQYDKQLSQAASRSEEAHKGNGLRKPPDFEGGGVAGGKHKSYADSDGEGGGDEEFSSDGFDPLFEEAVEIVLDEQRGSVSLLQRRLTIGYGRASRLIDQMEEAGVLGPYQGSKPRHILYSLDEWRSRKRGQGDAVE
jgi:S-DNA-T family DNA segregation ATPase FtsK/SpoIIIE